MSPTFAELAALSQPGQPPFILAMVVATGGSTPRLAGARMVITATGQQGTIGGGAFEHHVIQQARALLADPTRTVASVEVHLVHDLGMCCGVAQLLTLIAARADHHATGIQNNRTHGDIA